MTNTSNDIAIMNHMNAAARLLHHAFRQAETDDSEGFSGVKAILSAGGMIKLQTTLAPSTGISQLVVEVVELNGTEHHILSCSVERAPISG